MSIYAYPVNVLFAASALLLGSATVHAEIQLYETGPNEEISYLRFVNTTEQAVSIQASKQAKVDLGVRDEDRISRFYKIKAGSELSAMVLAEGQKMALKMRGSPWEYITVTVLPKGKTMLTRETPTDFNASRASLAMFNLDAACTQADMQGGAKNVAILNEVKPFTVQRRLINPVKLSATLSCSGDATTHAMDLPPLQAGERYSVFVMPKKGARHVVFFHDAQ